MPPGDSGWPIVGHFIQNIQDPKDFHLQRVQTFGSMSTYNMFSMPFLIVTDDDDVHWATVQERKGTTRPKILPHFMQLLGTESIFTKSGDDHKRLRKIFGPAFTPMAIKDYAQTIDKVVQTHLNEWCQSGQYQRPREWALLAMRIFFVCAFGDCDENRMKKLARLFEGWIDGFRAMPVRLPGGNLVRAHRFKQEIFCILREMIDEFKAANPPPPIGKSGSEQQQHKSVLGRLVYAVDEDGNIPSDKVLMDNLLFFLFAGFDTTKASFGALLHFLKHHPEAEKALTEEIRGFSGQEELDVDRLKFEAPVLNAVLAETWRLMAPLSGHTTCTLVDLYYKGYFIPKNTFIITDIHAHNLSNDNRYPGASDFHFERWLPKDHPLFDEQWANKESIDYNVMSNKFRSFNMGQHMCLGGHFAKMEVRIVCTRILQKYTVDIRNEKVMKFPLLQISNEFKLNPLSSSTRNERDE